MTKKLKFLYEYDAMYVIDWNAGEIYWALQENQLITNLDVFL